MTRSRGSRRIQALTRVGALVSFLSSCSESGTACVVPPCALPLALTVTVTATPPGAPVTGAFVSVTAPFTGVIPCTHAPGTTCDILGIPGTYELDIGAPGFQTLHRRVTVPGSFPKCGCEKVETQHLDVALTSTA